MTTRTYRAFGVDLESTFPLIGLETTREPSRPRVAVDMAARADLEAGDPEGEWHKLRDSSLPGQDRYRVERDDAGAHRFTVESVGVFYLSSGRELLLCGPSEPDAATWQRALLDTILASIALLAGFEGLHASAVELSGGVVALAGPTGAGKTTLAAELVDRGHPLFCDDALMLEASSDTIRAHPAPPLMTLPRGTGGAVPGWATATLAELEDETWVSVERAAREPRPLRAVCFVERRMPGAAADCVRIPSDPVGLLPHMLGALLIPERTRERFDVACDVAGGPMYRLDPGDERAGALADLLEAALAPESTSVGAGAA